MESKNYKFHRTLSPKLWDGLNLKNEVSAKLKQIADAFIDFMEINKDAVEDVVITGSMASYNYTPHSDIDLHVIVDVDKIHRDCPIVNEFLISKKSEFNNKHDIFIYGIPVEVYAEDYRNENIHNGLYSLEENKWLEQPKKLKPLDNDTAVEAKYNELLRAAKEVADKEQAEKLIDKIKQMRKAGLAKNGEFSVENLVFKRLRDNGIIEELMKTKKEGIDKELSLEENLNKVYENLIDETILLLEKFPLKVITEMEDSTVNNTGKEILDKLGNARSTASSKQLWKDIKQAYLNGDDKTAEKLKQFHKDAKAEVKKREEQLKKFEKLNAGRKSRKEAEKEKIEAIKKQYQDPSKVAKDSKQAEADQQNAQILQGLKNKYERIFNKNESANTVFECLIDSIEEMMGALDTGTTALGINPINVAGEKQPSKYLKQSKGESKKAMLLYSYRKNRHE